MTRAPRIALALVLLVALLALAAFGWREYLVHELRKPVLAELNDPDSAKFRDERYYGPWTVTKGLLCGDVNVKNLMGGYVGYRGFESYREKAIINSDAVKDLKVRTCDYLEPDKLPWWWIRW